MKWNKKEISSPMVKDLASRYGIDALTASILTRRGLVAPGEVLYILEDDPRYLHNPFLFDRMEDAVDRILLAKDEGEKVLVFGDRDVDGITSTVLVHEALAELGIDVSYRLPKENEPYGLSIDAVERFAAEGGTLVITVDCGISNRAEALRAAELGVDLIVVDHHLLQGGDPPEALAVVDPKLEGSGYPFRDLAGCGVAYKLAWALKFAQTELYKQQIALLNVKPVNDAFLIEAVRLTNLVETGRISETVVPGMIDLGKTRLVPFLQDQQIFVWDGALQKKLLAQALGTSAEVAFFDAAPEIASHIPQARGLSLLRLREKSRIGKYRDKALEEIDVFANLFVSFVLKKINYFADDDLERLQLVALGTIADMMPLRDENRILVRKGLEALNAKPRAGVAEIVARQGLSGRKISSHDVAWQLTPVVNAAGRMGSPETAVRLFLEKDPAARAKLADEIVAMNQDRRQMGADSWETLQPLLRASVEKHEGKLALILSETLHRGITGLMASRAASTFRVPAIIATRQADGVVSGSIRSARGFDVRGYLEACSDLFVDYGGHESAAGFSMALEKWSELEQRTESFAVAFEPSDDEKTIDVDAELPHDLLTPELAALTDRFEPYGENNQRLVFMARRVPIASIDLVGKREQNHVKMVLDFGKHKWPSLYWDAASRIDAEFPREGPIDLVFNLTRNWYNGMEQLQLVVLDARSPAARTEIPDRG